VADLAARSDDPLPSADPEVSIEAELHVKFASYIERQERAVARTSRLETLALPIDLDYAAIPALRTHARQQLVRVRPLTLGQAGRIEGVTPADISVILVWMQHARQSHAVSN